jgi:hypothetical protein
VNVLILTPDAVGSTLLQRLITIYMQVHEFNRPVINLHELTNGLEKYWSPEFNREIVSKRQVQNWSYYQTLDQIVEILSSVDHYKTSRLAQYHIRKRQDPVEQQIPFYRYLDENFFIIACRRHNVFEHALSMAINSVTKKLNVYNHSEKISTFLGMYLDPIQVDEQVFANQLDAYRDYLQWSQNHFNVASYFYYDQHLDNMERYILDLPIWPRAQTRMTWYQKFGIEFNDWNRCHHIPSDLGALTESGVPVYDLIANQPAQEFEDTIRLYQQSAPEDWPPVHTKADYLALPDTIKCQFSELQRSGIQQHCLPIAAQNYLARNLANYNNAQTAIQRMQELDIIVSAPPIKKQTLKEKISIINNVDRCLDIYNEWTEKNPGVASALSRNHLDSLAAAETKFWQSFTEITNDKPDRLSIGL